MRFRLRTLLIVLALIALSETANAQPVFRVKHYWAVDAGPHSYGITEYVADGGYRDTTIHLGPWGFRTKLSAVQVVMIGAMPPMLLAGVVAMAVSSRKRSTT